MAMSMSSRRDGWYSRIRTTEWGRAQTTRQDGTGTKKAGTIVHRRGNRHRQDAEERDTEDADETVGQASIRERGAGQETDEGA